jgi:transcriptional regulator with XRE-family HTH domain
MAGRRRDGSVGTEEIDLLRFVGHRLREERLLAGLSQEELGREIGTDGEALQAYEGGKRRVNAERLLAALKVLGLPLSLFFRGSSSRPSSAVRRRTGLRVPGIMVERPPELSAGWSVPEFRSLLALWEARRGVMNADLLAELVGGRLTRKMILLRQPAGSSRLLVEQYGEGIAFVRPCQALSLVGHEYRDLPDRDFSRWVLRGYAAALSTGRPRLESTLADILTPDAIVMRSRFDRLLLPWHGGNGDRFVVSVPLIRRRSIHSAAHEPISAAS